MNGILLVNKEKDMTSRDMVNKVSHIFDVKKMGHTGTLDPLATGILVICIGKYTKLVSRLTSLKKEYEAEITLGIKTDTLDITGEILEKRDCKVEKEDVIKVFDSLIGEYKQKIPLYSAKKIDGKKLYEYARKGIIIERPENIVNIYDIKLLDLKDNKISFLVNVEKGTYIRSLIETICERLNVIGTMSKLIRTKQGIFDLKDSFTLDDIKNGIFKLLNASDVLGYKTYNLNDEEYFKVKNGSRIIINSNEEYLILIYHDKEIAIYKKDGEYFKCDVMFI